MKKEYNGLTSGNPKKGSNYNPKNAPTEMGVGDSRHEGKVTTKGVPGTGKVRKGAGRDGN